MREKVFSDTVTAMKSQDKEVLSVLRMLKGAIQLEEISKKRELNDEEVISAVSKQIKARKESIEQFAKGDRHDLIEKTNAEINILSKYLPKQLSESEIQNIVIEVIEEVNATSTKDIGKVMGILVPRIKGKADMSLVNEIIKNKLKD